MKSYHKKNLQIKPMTLFVFDKTITSINNQDTRIIVLLYLLKALVHIWHLKFILGSLNHTMWLFLRIPTFLPSWEVKYYVRFYQTTLMIWTHENFSATLNFLATLHRHNLWSFPQCSGNTTLKLSIFLSNVL